MSYADPRWPTANAYIYGYADASVPGHRTVAIGGVDRTVVTGYRRMDDHITALGTQLAAAGWSIETQDSGRVRFWGASLPVAYPDRLGWLLGCATDSGQDESGGAAVTEVLARIPSPAMVPLLGVQWEQVEVTREQVATLDRQARSHGYVWGGARVWAVKCTMDRWAFDSLKIGWVLRGQISIDGAVASAVGSAVPAGTLTGHALGLRGVRWFGPDRSLVEVTILVSGVLA